MATLSHEISGRDASTIAAIAGRSSSYPHLITSGKDVMGRPVVTAHTTKSVSTRRERAELLADLRNSGIEMRFQVRTHSEAKLAGVKTLEELVARYGKTEFLHDPTHGFGRSAALVSFAGLVRSELEDSVAGIYWNPRWRALYVVLSHANYFQDGKVKVADLASAEAAVKTALERSCGFESESFVRSLRLGFEIPDLELVPVDKASHFGKRGSFPGLRYFTNAPMLAAMICVGAVGTMSAGTASAQGMGGIEISEPAVSGLNGKLAIMGGGVDGNVSGGDGAGFVAGSITTPLFHSSGLQIDGVAGKVGDDEAWGVGGHLFWRNPASGLLGVTAGFTEFKRDGNGVPDQTFAHVGAEGELYLDQFTFAATAGHQFGDDIDEGFYGAVDVAWYATDNLRLSIGLGTNPDIDILGTGGIEFQPAMAGFTGLTIFADGAVGEDDYASVLGGVRFYFGASNTLKDRHRKDDPVSNIPLMIIQQGGGVQGGGVQPAATNTSNY